MKQMALAMLDNGEVMTTVNVMTQLMRLHQITCGHFKADDGTTTALKNNRMDALLQLLEETDGKVIIWANYREDIKNIVAALKKAYGDASTVEYHGGWTLPSARSILLSFSKKTALHAIL